nr:adenylate cyclase [Hymenolepis microstoma]
MAHRSCVVSHLFQSAFSPVLSLWQLRLFFILLLFITIISTALSTARLLNARILSQQPFLYFSSLVSCIVGFLQCRSKNLEIELCHAHTTKRLRQATLCASIAITLFTLAALPTPSLANRVGPDLTRIDMWLLLALTLCVQVCILSGRARHLVCGVIALAHSIMVIVTRFTSERISSADSDCIFCWNSNEVRFWREIGSNLVAFTISSLIGWHLSCQNNHERWRCFCVALHASDRQSTLRSTQKKLSRISQSIVPPALVADLEHDFSSTPCVWSSPLVIYLRNVSFLSAELVGFCTSNGTSGNNDMGSMSPMIANVGIQELERYPQPASRHVVAFIDHLVIHIKSLCVSHGCYAVHVRPGEILCIAGYPEVRVDHANSCVQLALAINRLLRSISNAAHVHLEARMAIHTGEAYAAVLGQSMLTFDLLGADVFHLRRQLRTAAKPGRVLVSRATFDQLPEGYEGELGPTVIDPSTNRHVLQCETLYVQPRKSTDTSMSSNQSTETRWPTLGESIATGGLAQAFARLANHAIRESGESSGHSTRSSASVSVLRQIREKGVWLGSVGDDIYNKNGVFNEVTLCLKGLCDHRTTPTPSFLDISNSKISTLEGQLLSNPPSSLLVTLCHGLSSLPSSVSSLLVSPPSSLSLEESNSSLPRCKVDGCDDSHSIQQPLTTGPIKCETCPRDSEMPDLGVLCPFAEAVLWNRLFLRKEQLNTLRNALAWMLLLVVLLGAAGGLLITKVSYALIVYPCSVAWCLILLAVFSIRRLDQSTETRWPTLGESIATGGLAQAFARLANHAIRESGESSGHSTRSSASVSVLRQIREKGVWLGSVGDDIYNKNGVFNEVTLCLKGLCDHRTTPTPSFLDISNSKISTLEGQLLSNPPSSLLVTLCHGLSSLPSSVSSLLVSPPSSLSLEESNSSLPRCKVDGCDDSHSIQQPLTTGPIKCETCPRDSEMPDLGVLCPFAEAVLWNRLFLRKEQLNTLRNALAWMLLLVVLLGAAGGLLITKVSYALIVYPCSVAWCLILLAVFSIRRLDRFSCFPLMVRQACVVFTIFLLLASLLFILTFLPFEVQQTSANLNSPWLPITQLGTTSQLACLGLLLLLTLTPSVPPTPINSAIVAAIFSCLHISLAITRFMHVPPLSTANGVMSFWMATVPDAVAAHIVFILLICLLPWQTAKLHMLTEQWVKFILQAKVELTRCRFALEHLLENRIPRTYMQTEPNRTLSESNTDSTNLSDLFPPKENLATAVIAITIHGIGKGDEMLQHQRSPIRTAGLSQSITTTATTASSSNSVSASHRSREATVLADAVRRLNRRICLIDQMACGGTSEENPELIDSSLERVIKSISRPSLPLVKVNSVGNCVAYALMETEAKDSLSKLGAFAAFLIRLFEELESHYLQKSGEEQRNVDETFVCRLQIGLHVGATVSGVVDGPQFLLLHETLDFALRLATSSPPSLVDKSIIIASSDFIARRGGERLIGLQAIGVNGSSGENDAFLWCSDVQHISRLSSAMRPVLSAAIQPPVVRNRTKKTMTSPKFSQPRSTTSANSNASPPPPPPPPHKRNYAIGEARYQNHNSPLISNRNRKTSSPLLPPRHASPSSKWTQNAVSLDVHEDNVDRACFAMGDVEIVNGYAQPTTRLLGNGATASPYCVTKDTNGYSNHTNRQSAFEMHKRGTILTDVSKNSLMSSENDFLVAEGACERIAQSDGVTSVSSMSPSNTNHHHSNPLYTDNEYYDEEDLSVDGINDMNGIKNPEGVSDGGLDAGLEWLQRAPMVGDFTVSVTSNGSNYPNYRRPSPPPSNPRRTLYDRQLTVGGSPLGNGNNENQRRLSMKQNENKSVSIDMLSTCVAPSVGCEYEFEAVTTDFSANENDDEDVDDFDDDDNDQDLEMEVSEANNEKSPLSEPVNVPLLMNTSWMTSADGAGHGDGWSHDGNDGCASKGKEMSDSMLVETGGPLDDDFSEFSSSAAAIVSGVNDDVSSSANNLVTYTTDGNLDEDCSDSAFLPIYFPLPDQSSNQRGRRLPDVAPVSLPNFGGGSTGLPTTNQIRKPSPPPLLMDLTCVPPMANSDTSDLAEYDNLENAYSSPLQPAVQASINNNRLPLNASQRSGGWRPRDAKNHRKGCGGSQLLEKIDQQVRINVHIVDEARRICQRLHAMGWESALSLLTHSSESNPTDPFYRTHHNDLSARKSKVLLPPPPQPSSRISKRGVADYVNSQSLLRRLQGFDSGTVTTITSQIDDDQLTDDGTFDSELLVEEEAADFENNGEENYERFENGKKGSMLVISDLWFNLGYPRSLSNDCLPLHAPEIGYRGDKDDDNNQNRHHNDGVLDRDVILRRAANVRKFLPPELHPFVMPGCFSSVSATTTYATRSRAAVLCSKKSGQNRKANGNRRDQKCRHVLVATRVKGMKRSSSDPLLPNSSGTNLDVSLI